MFKFKINKKNVLEKLNKYPLHIRQMQKINKLKNEVNSLQDTIKNELYISFMARLSENYEVERLRKENKALRLKIKELKKVNGIEIEKAKNKEAKTK